MAEISDKHSSIAFHRLQKEYALLASAFDSVEESLILVDEAGTIRYVNRAGRELTGLADLNLREENLWKRLPELGRALAGTTKSDNAMLDVELFYPEHRWVRAQISSLAKEETAGHRLFSVLLRDITAERDSARERIESERINSIVSLAAGVAHEIGNPLNSLQIHLGLIKKRLDKVAGTTENGVAFEKIEKSVGICASEIERLDVILKDFLGAIRNQKPTLVQTDVSAVVVNVLRVMQPQIQERRVHCNIEVAPLLPRIMGDNAQLNQLFFNIVKNALEAMTDGGALNIVLRFDDEFVFVDIKDSGCGISHEDLAKIYEPFYTTKANGHGLGMMIVERIMKSHNAQLSIESELGAGTKFTFCFPRIDRRAKTLV
ncbi:MAG: PAS domain S-box protein [Opitutales bacterium]|nr:PAS domain S-box protein [Opitutales bacterium]